MPQELEVWHVIPALRRELVKAMLKKGLKQNQIANYLGLTEPAVSQYISGKRGKEISFDDEIQNEIKNSVEAIMSNPMSLMDEMQRLIRVTRQKRVICRMHINEGKIPAKCEACLK